MSEAELHNFYEIYGPATMEHQIKNVRDRSCQVMPAYQLYALSEIAKGGHWQDYIMPGQHTSATPKKDTPREHQLGE